MNLPKNAGERTTLVFTVPPIPNLAPSDRMQIHLTSNFPRDVGNDIYCGMYITKSNDKGFITYKNLLKLTDGKEKTYNYYPVDCFVDEDYVISFLFANSEVSEIDFESFWINWIIRNAKNPGTYLAHENFQISYYNSQTSSITWQFDSPLSYFISQSPKFVKLSQLKISDTNIRNPAQYDMKILSNDIF